MVFGANRAQQLVLEVWMQHDVVARELHGCAAAQQLSARIADMRQRVRLTAQHQRRQSDQSHDRLAAPVDAGQPLRYRIEKYGLDSSLSQSSFGDLR